MIILISLSISEIMMTKICELDESFKKLDIFSLQLYNYHLIEMNGQKSQFFVSSKLFNFAKFLLIR